MSRLHLHRPRNLGEHAADLVVGGMGSWRFVIIQTLLVLVWVTANVILLTEKPFDPFPFILLNLAFSTQAAYASPLILMASNRQAQKDRARDDLEASEVDEILNIHREVLAINKAQMEILETLREPTG